MESCLCAICIDGFCRLFVLSGVAREDRRIRRTIRSHDRQDRPDRVSWRKIRALGPDLFLSEFVWCGSSKGRDGGRPGNTVVCRSAGWSPVSSFRSVQCYFGFLPRSLERPLDGIWLLGRTSSIFHLARVGITKPNKSAHPTAGNVLV